jgi:hypothetical protein
MRSITFVTLLFFFHSVEAQLFKVPFERKLTESTVIAEGTVIHQYCFWNEAHTLIFTSNTILVHKVFKGSLPAGTLQVITQGGVVDNWCIEVSELLQLNIGETGVFFCSPNASGVKDPGTGGILYDVYSSRQGFFLYDDEHVQAYTPFANQSIRSLYKSILNSTGQHFERLSDLPLPAHDIMTDGTAALTGFSPSIVNGGAYNDSTNNLLTITGSGFGNNPANRAGIKFKNADNDNASPDFDINFDDPEVISWSDTKIKVRVPSKAATGTIAVSLNNGSLLRSSVPLTVYYSVLTAKFNFNGNTISTEPRLMNTDGSGGYTIRYSTSTAGSGVNITTSPVKDVFDRALNTWRDMVGLNFKSGGTTSLQKIDVSDGVNLAVIDNSNTSVPPLSNGVLAVTYSGFSMCTNVKFDAQKPGFDVLIRNSGFSNGSINFNEEPCFTTRGEYDLETVILHELGHALNLAHVYDDADFSTSGNYNTLNPATLMHYSVLDFAIRRSPDGSSMLGGLYSVTRQNNTYGECGLFSQEMAPIVDKRASLDACPMVFPTTAINPGANAFIDLANSSADNREDPRFTQINCNNSGVAITNNAYYAFKTDATPNQTLRLCITGYGTSPSEQVDCDQQGVRMSLYKTNKCPGQGLFPDPLYCNTFTGNGELEPIPGLEANTTYLLYFDGLQNTRAFFNVAFNAPPGCAGSTENALFLTTNPIADRLTIRFENANGSRYQLALFDVMGRLVFTSVVNINLQIQTETIIADQFAAGIYFLRLIDEAGNVTEKKVFKYTK